MTFPPTLPEGPSPCFSPPSAGAFSAPPERGKEEELLTFPEAGAILKVKRTRLYAMLRTGELRAVKIGKLWRISRKSIEEYLARSVYPGKQYRENE